MADNLAYAVIACNDWPGARDWADAARPALRSFLVEEHFDGADGGVAPPVEDARRGDLGVVDGRQLLSAESVRLMTTDHTTAAQRAASELFLEGQGWGFGGSVDVPAIDPWNVLGRYGWVGGTGTAAHIVPSTGTVTILLSQLQMGGPTPPALMRDLWTYAAQR